MGAGKIIKGWEIGIKSMKVGEKAEFTIKSEYAYGLEGMPPKIPHDATLIFKIELLQTANRFASRWKMSDTELLEEAQRLKSEGNEEYKAKSYNTAIARYRDAMAHIE